MAAMLVDTHCHLNHDQFHGDSESAVLRAQEAGVSRLVVVGYDLDSSEIAVSLATEIPSVFAVVGIHPHDARNYGPNAEIRVRELAAAPRVVAIGEIGLDFHYDFPPVTDQRTAFRAQLAVAHELGMPVVIHCRDAYGETLEELERWTRRGLSGVMHCWGGSADQADRAVSIGLLLGFGGVLTFKNADDIRKIASNAPLGNVVLETDAPYLAPVPFRGKRNEPAYTRIVAEKFAELRSLNLEEVAEATTANAERLFPKLAQ